MIGTTPGAIFGVLPGFSAAFGAVLEEGYRGPVMAGVIMLPPTLGYFLGREMVITLGAAETGAAARAPQ